MAKKSRKLGEAHVDVTGNLTPLQKSLMKAKSMLRSGMKILGRIAKVGALAIGTAISFGIFQALKRAGEAEEIQAKFETLFKHLSADANAFADTLANAVGRSKKDIKEWMAGLQDLFVPLGFSREEALKLDKALVKLAIDVASFSNKVDADVIRDFTSALVGNHETVRKFGIIISETALKQEALNTGITKNFSELTNLEKVQLRYNLIVQGSTDAIGDAERTTGSYTNQLKRLRAMLDDLAVLVGNALLPKITSILLSFNEWIKTNKNLIAQQLGLVVAKIGDALKWAVEHANQLVIAFKALVALELSIVLLEIGTATITVAKALATLKIAAITAWAAMLSPLALIIAAGAGIATVIKKTLDLAIALTKVAKLKKENKELDTKEGRDLAAYEKNQNKWEAKQIRRINKERRQKETLRKKALENVQLKDPTAALKESKGTEERNSVVDLASVWTSLSTTAQKQDQKLEILGKQQLQEAQKQTGIMTAGFNKLGKTWSA